MIINLCFHGIGRCLREREAGEARYWISQDAFLGALDLAAAHSNVGLSFDDGNRSDIEIGLPALVERGLSATFFALAGRLDDPASLAAVDLRQLRAAGMTIGCHGWSHIPWRGLRTMDAHREFVEARAALAEASQGPVDEAALPLGRYDRGVLRNLKRSGYRTVYTSDRFPARSGAWLQARYSVTSTDTAESIGRIITRRSPLREARNLAVSLIKRAR